MEKLDVIVCEHVGNTNIAKKFDIVDFEIRELKKLICARMGINERVEKLEVDLAAFVKTVSIAGNNNALAQHSFNKDTAECLLDIREKHNNLCKRFLKLEAKKKKKAKK